MSAPELPYDRRPRGLCLIFGDSHGMICTLAAPWSLSCHGRSSTEWKRWHTQGKEIHTVYLVISHKWIRPEIVSYRSTQS